MADTSKPKGIRWMPALAIILLAFVSLAFVWRSEFSRQERILGTGITFIVSFVLLFFWALFLSRFRWLTRVKIFLAAAALIAITALSFEITGVTGDLLPIIRPRWKKPPELPKSVGPAVPSGPRTPS